MLGSNELMIISKYLRNFDDYVNYNKINHKVNNVCQNWHINLYATNNYNNILECYPNCNIIMYHENFYDLELYSLLTDIRIKELNTDKFKKANKTIEEYYGMKCANEIYSLPVRCTINNSTYLVKLPRKSYVQNGILISDSLKLIRPTVRMTYEKFEVLFLNEPGVYDSNFKDYTFDLRNVIMPDNLKDFSQYNWLPVECDCYNAKIIFPANIRRFTSFSDYNLNNMIIDLSACTNLENSYLICNAIYPENYTDKTAKLKDINWINMCKKYIWNGPSTDNRETFIPSFIISLSAHIENIQLQQYHITTTKKRYRNFVETFVDDTLLTDFIYKIDDYEHEYFTTFDESKEKIVRKLYNMEICKVFNQSKNICYNIDAIDNPNDVRSNNAYKLYIKNLNDNFKAFWLMCKIAAKLAMPILNAIQYNNKIDFSVDFDKQGIDKFKANPGKGYMRYIGNHDD
jgi:hypothetical protein